MSWALTARQSFEQTSPTPCPGRTRAGCKLAELLKRVLLLSLCFAGACANVFFHLSRRKCHFSLSKTSTEVPNYASLKPGGRGTESLPFSLLDGKTKTQKEEVTFGPMSWSESVTKSETGTRTYWTLDLSPFAKEAGDAIGDGYVQPSHNMVLRLPMTWTLPEREHFFFSTTSALSLLLRVSISELRSPPRPVDFLLAVAAQRQVTAHSHSASASGSFQLAWRRKTQDIRFPTPIPSLPVKTTFSKPVAASLILAALLAVLTTSHSSRSRSHGMGKPRLCF